MKFRELFCAMVGLVVAYFAAYLGDGAHGFMVSAENKLQILFLAVASIVAGLIGIVYVTYYLVHRRPEAGFVAPSDQVGGMLVGPSFLAYAFGAASGPFANFGFAPWKWMAPFSILIVIAALPALFECYNVVEKYIDGKKHKKDIERL